MGRIFGSTFGFILLILAIFFGLFPEEDTPEPSSEKDSQEIIEYLGKEWSQEEIREFNDFLEEILHLKEGDIIFLNLNEKDEEVFPVRFEVIGFHHKGAYIKTMNEYINNTFILNLWPEDQLIKTFEMTLDILSTKKPNSFQGSNEDYGKI